MPARGLIVGCSTSYILFIYHQAVKRLAGEARVDPCEPKVGLKGRLIPGSTFASTGTCERINSRRKRYCTLSCLQII